MAITDNNFTEAEIVSAIDANPALAAVIKTGLGQKKYVVQDETEHADFLKNYNDTEYKKKVIGEHTSEFALKFEKDVLEQTGIPKLSQDEKYYDYYKRAMGVKLGTVKQMETELENLKKGGNQSEADKLRISQLEAGIAAKDLELNDKLSAKDKEINSVKVGSVLETSFLIVRPKYKAGLPESMVKLAENAVKEKIAPNIRVQADGKTIVVDDKGETIVNKTNYMPKTVDEVILEELADMIDAGKKGAGSGTGADELDGAEGKKGEFKGLPPEVKTKLQLTDYLHKLGILAGTPEFDKIFDEHSKGLKLR